VTFQAVFEWNDVRFVASHAQQTTKVDVSLGVATALASVTALGKPAAGGSHEVHCGHGAGFRGEVRDWQTDLNKRQLLAVE
jgi:hypothetical protein